MRDHWMDSLDPIWQSYSALTLMHSICSYRLSFKISFDLSTFSVSMFIIKYLMTLVWYILDALQFCFSNASSFPFRVWCLSSNIKTAWPSDFQIHPLACICTSKEQSPLVARQSASLHCLMVTIEVLATSVTFWTGEMTIPKVMIMPRLFYQRIISTLCPEHHTMNYPFLKGVNFLLKETIMETRGNCWLWIH